MRRLVAAFVLIAVLGIACSDQPAPVPTPTFAPPPTLDPEGSSQNERQRPPANVAPVAAPSPRNILISGDVVPFKVCSKRTGWQRPGPEEMTQVFTDRRFGDGVSPYPLEYTLYLTHFYTLVPFANSVNKYTNAFSGFWDNSGQLEEFCDQDELRKDPSFLVLQFVGYEVREIKRDGQALVFVVEARLDGWQAVVYPYPPTPPSWTITSRQVVDTSGRLLHQELWPSDSVAWQQSLQYGPSGNLQFVVLGGILPLASAPITIGPGQAPLLLYSSSPAETVVPGSLRVLDATGAEVARLDWQDGKRLWEPLGTLDLPPGTYRLLFADQRSDWHHFTLLAADVPLPPGAE